MLSGTRGERTEDQLAKGLDHDRETLSGINDLMIRLWKFDSEKWPALQILERNSFRVWLGGRDSNPDNVVQSHVSYR